MYTTLGRLYRTQRARFPMALETKDPWCVMNQHDFFLLGQVQHRAG
jgi:hypothetical protein